MIIKILGGEGCKNCSLLEENARKAVDDLQLEAEVIKLTNIQDIMQYDIMAAPGLVIDDKLVSSGKVLKVKEILNLLK